jgi:hypothetical protein
MKGDDAKRTVQPGSSDHILLALARLETLTEENMRHSEQASKLTENRMLQLHKAIGEVVTNQGSLMREVGLLTQGAKHNADHIMELKNGLDEHWKYLHRVEKELDLVHANQKTCIARNFWHELQSAYNEDSKVIEVMRQKLNEHKASTPPSGFSVRISSGKAVSLPVKAIILALLGVLLGAGATVATALYGNTQTQKALKMHSGDQP